MNAVVYRQRKGRNPLQESAFSHPVNALTGDRGNLILAQNPSLRTPLDCRRQNPDSYCLRVAGVQESATENRTFDRTSRAKKKLSVSERPVDRRPQTYLKDILVSCFQTINANKDVGSAGPSF